MHYIDYLLHFDIYLEPLIQSYGALAYIILFAIIFLETGLVLAPFLPGDSLLFIAGTFAAQGHVQLFIVLSILTLAAILGDSVNYAIGSYFGRNVFVKTRFFKREYLEKTEKFYRIYGPKTIVFARFIPIIRTFAPFVAGVGKMKYSKFLMFNVIGGIAWVALFVFGGYFFGQIAWVRDNLLLVTLLIIIVSILPAIIEIIREKYKK